VLHFESLENRALLAACCRSSEASGEQSTLDSTLPACGRPNFGQFAASQSFSHNDGTAYSTITRVRAASITGNSGINLDILANGSVALHGIAGILQTTGTTDDAGKPGFLTVTIMPTGSEKKDDPVSLTLDFAFRGQDLRLEQCDGRFQYSASYTYNGVTTPLASSSQQLGGSGITPIGPRAPDHEAGTLDAKIGDTFTLSFSETLNRPYHRPISRRRPE